MKKLSIISLVTPLATLIAPVSAFAQGPTVPLDQQGAPAIPAGTFDPCVAGTGSIIERLGCTQTVGAGDIIGGVVNFIFVIAVILALGFLIYGGVRWITSGGDKGGVENARNTIIAAIVGLVIVVLAYFILNAVILPFLGVTGGFGELDVTPITQKEG